MVLTVLTAILVRVSLKARSQDFALGRGGGGGGGCAHERLRY